MTDRRPVSRRDFFLRLRSSGQGRILELSCHTLFMRCSDATRTVAAAEPDDEPGAGEPPAVWSRRTPEEIMAAIDRELHDVEVLRLVDPEWLDNLAGGDRLAEIVAGFQSRGGRVERLPAS